MDNVRYELKVRIIEELNLQDITPEQIDDDAPLFADGLGLDSIDALELVVIMENYFGVKVPNEMVGKQVLESINTMATYIEKNREE